jgi:hypothetical protein
MRRPRKDHLPVAPVLALLRDYHSKHQLLDKDDCTWTRLAEDTGISERSIRRWAAGEAQSIRIDLADRLALGLGQTLFMIWHWTDELGGAGQVRCEGPGCTATFEPARRNQRFHDDACKMRAYRLRRAA